MTWICGIDGCQAVRAGLSEMIISAEKMANLRIRIRELEATGDMLAHCLIYRDFKNELERWRLLREGNCTVCHDPYTSETTPPP